MDLRGTEEAAASRALRRFQIYPRHLRPIYHRFAVLPSNIGGLEAGLLFAAGVNPFVALVGPTGWGKSHLLRVTAEQWHLESGTKVRIRSAGSYLVRRGRWDIPGPLILDDAQMCLVKPRERQAFRNALELRTRLGRPTLVAFTSEKPASSHLGLLPQAHKWVAADVPAPKDLERQAILRLLLDIEGLTMSDRLVHVLASIIRGSGDALLGAVQRLGLIQSEWLSFEDELMALGIVQPLTDGNWDLCRWIDRTIEATTEPLGLDFCPELTRCLSIHFLRGAMGLAEETVAQYYRIEPGDVFSHERAFRTALADPKVYRLEKICAEALSGALDRI